MSKTFKQFKEELLEAERVEPSIGDLTKKELKTPKEPKITKKGLKSIIKPASTPTPVKNPSMLAKVAKEIPNADVRAANKMANAASSVAKKVINSPIAQKVASNPIAKKIPGKIAAPLAALDVGLGSGELARKGLNAFGPSTKGDKIKNNAKSGLEFKGDLPTLPKEFPKKEDPAQPKRSVSQSELGSALRNEPQKLNVPTPNKIPMGSASSGVSAGVKGGLNNPPSRSSGVAAKPARSSSGGSSSARSSSPVAGSATKSAPIAKPQSAMSKSTTSSKTQAAPSKSAPIAKPMAKSQSAPIKKALPTRKAEADPNAGGFKAARVTATASKSNSGGVQNFKNVYQNKTGKLTSLTPTPTKKNPPSGGKWM